MASIAQEEVRKLSERLRFGYKRSIEKGRVLGQNNILGYYKKDGRLNIHEEQALIVRKIFELYNEGRLGVRRIAIELEKQGILSPFTGKMLSPETIKSVITNPKYKGFYCSGKTVSIDYRHSKRIRLSPEQWNVYKDENIPAIVSEESWNWANALYKERSQKCKTDGQAYQARYTFSGKIFCAEHNTAYHRHVYKSKKRGAQEVWNCKLYRQKGKVDGCDSPTIYTSELLSVLNDIYKSVFINKDRVIQGLLEIYSSVERADYSKENATTIREIDKINIRKDKLLDLSIDGTITKTEFAKRNNKLNEELSLIEAKLEQLAEQQALDQKAKKDLSGLKKSLENEFESGESFNLERNNIFLDKITVHKLNGDKNHLRLEILLKFGSSYAVHMKSRQVLSLSEIGISQAQVSRLEKSALKNMKKYIG
jgi:hypothetical protein